MVLLVTVHRYQGLTLAQTRANAVFICMKTRVDPDFQSLRGSTLPVELRGHSVTVQSKFKESQGRFQFSSLVLTTASLHQCRAPGERRLSRVKGCVLGPGSGDVCM